MPNIQVFGDLYTNKKGDDLKAVCYNLENLDLRDCLARVNKVSPNGVALTIAVTLRSPFESKVSKGAAEKGTTAIKKDKGEVLIFDANISVKDDRKPGEVNGRCETLINAFAGKMTKDGKEIDLGIPATPDGSIILLTWDGPSIPMKGIQKVSSLKQNLGDKDESIVFIEQFDLNNESLSEAFAPELEALNASKFVEQQGYQKGKSYEQLFLERLDYAHKITASPDGAELGKIASIFGETLLWSDEGLNRWEVSQCPNVQAVLVAMLSH